MAEKTYKLSLQQLNDLVSDAVNTAIRKLDNLEIIDDEGTGKGANDIEVTQMDDEQYREAMDTMARNRGAGSSPAARCTRTCGRRNCADRNTTATAPAPTRANTR